MGDAFPDPAECPAGRGAYGVQADMATGVCGS